MDAGAGRLFYEFFSDTLRGLAFYFVTAFVAVLCADPSEQYAQVVGDFCDSAYRRAWVP